LKSRLLIAPSMLKTLLGPKGKQARGRKNIAIPLSFPIKYQPHLKVPWSYFYNQRNFTSIWGFC